MRLLTGVPVWRVATGGSNTALGGCGDRLVVSYQRLAVLDAARGTLLVRDALQSRREIVTSGMVQDGAAVVMSGPAALYSFRCPG